MRLEIKGIGIDYQVKGVVQSKISLGYVKVDDGLGETLLFSPNKIRQKLTENQRVKYVNFACFENTISRQNLLPQHDP